jgi:hypothetical protein
VVDTEWAQYWIVNPLLKKPGVWFFVNLCLCKKLNKKAKISLLTVI